MECVSNLLDVEGEVMRTSAESSGADSRYVTSSMVKFRNISKD